MYYFEYLCPGLVDTIFKEAPLPNKRMGEKGGV
jgi:hypothetical protein